MVAQANTVANVVALMSTLSFVFIRLGDGRAATGAATHPPAPDNAPEICPQCSGSFAAPTHWRQRRSAASALEPCSEEIALPAQGADDLRFPGGVTELLAQPRHREVDASIDRLDAAASRQIEELVARQQPARVVDESRQKPAFGIRQVAPCTRPGDSSRALHPIEGPALELHDRAAAFAWPPARKRRRTALTRASSSQGSKGLPR